MDRRIGIGIAVGVGVGVGWFAWKSLHFASENCGCVLWAASVYASVCSRDSEGEEGREREKECVCVLLQIGA